MADPHPARGVGAIVVIALLLLVAANVFLWMAPGVPAGRATPRDAVEPVAPPVERIGTRATVLRIAMGSGKSAWMNWAARAFEASAAGAELRIDLVEDGSLVAAEQVLAGPGDEPIHVWAPSSSVYRASLERAWRKRHGTELVLESGYLAQSVVVLVIWEARRAALADAPVDLAAMAKSSTEWGRFKFGYADPARADGGLIARLLMVHAGLGRTTALTEQDLVAAETIWRAARCERWSPRAELAPSTAALTRAMLQRGPSAYDAILTFESLAIESIRAAADRWGPLSVQYPAANLWVDHPYCVLDVPWSGDDARRGARAFLQFLQDERAQRQALRFGLRPSHPAVALDADGSPFRQLAQHGVRVSVEGACEPPVSAVVVALSR